MGSVRICPRIQSIFDTTVIIHHTDKFFSGAEFKTVNKSLIQKTLFGIKKDVRNPEFLGIAGNGGIDIKIKFGLKFQDPLHSGGKGQVQTSCKPGVIKVDNKQTECIKIKDRIILRPEHEICLGKHFRAGGVDFHVENTAHAEQLRGIFLNRWDFEFECASQRNRKGVWFEDKSLSFMVNRQLAVFQINEVLFIIVSVIYDLPLLARFHTLHRDVFRNIYLFGCKGIFQTLWKSIHKAIRAQIRRQFAADTVIINGKKLIPLDPL